MRTIKAKLSVSLILLTAVVAVVTIIGAWATRGANEGLRTVFEDRVKPLRDLKVVADLYAVNIVDTAHKLRNGNIDWSEASKAADEAQSKLKTHWNAYTATYMDAKEKALAAAAARSMEAGNHVVSSLRAAIAGKDKSGLDTLVIDKLYQGIDPISDAIGKLVELQIDEAQAQFTMATDAYIRSLWIEGATLLVALAVLGFALWTTFHGVIRPISGMTESMKLLASGDTTKEVPGVGRHDEIGEMAAAVQVFKDNMIETERLRAEQVENEKRAAEEKRAAMHKLADDFQSSVGGIIGTVSSAATELEAAAGTLTKTAETTQQLATVVAAASEEASSNVNSVASATEELGSSVNEISRQVQESSKIASEAVKQAEKTDGRIAELSQAASRIGDVVKLITAIAEQTNLLALNATIEAARAGEAGRGFAVVAQEVKALAAQTAKATDEIGTQISGMQAATEDSVAAIKEIGGTIGRIAEIASAIAVAVEEQGAATQEISRNVAQAAQGTAQVAANITDVNQGAGETGTASGQVLSSAQQLAGESNRLKTEVDKFLATVRAA